MFEYREGERERERKKILVATQTKVADSVLHYNQVLKFYLFLLAFFSSILLN